MHLIVHLTNRMFMLWVAFKCKSLPNALIVVFRHLNAHSNASLVFYNFFNYCNKVIKLKRFSVQLAIYV